MKGFAIVDGNGQHVAVVPGEHGFDVYHGRERVYCFNLEPSTMRLLALCWLRWWAFHAWFGLRGRWAERRARAALARRADEQLRHRSWHAD